MSGKHLLRDEALYLANHPQLHLETVRDLRRLIQFVRVHMRPADPSQFMAIVISSGANLPAELAKLDFGFQGNYDDLVLRACLALALRVQAMSADRKAFGDLGSPGFVFLGAMDRDPMHLPHPRIVPATPGTVGPRVNRNLVDLWGSPNTGAVMVRFAGPLPDQIRQLSVGGRHSAAGEPHLEAACDRLGFNPANRIQAPAARPGNPFTDRPHLVPVAVEA